MNDSTKSNSKNNKVVATHSKVFYIAKCNVKSSTLLQYYNQIRKEIKDAKFLEINDLSKSILDGYAYIVVRKYNDKQEIHSFFSEVALADIKVKRLKEENEDLVSAGVSYIVNKISITELY